MLGMSLVMGQCLRLGRRDDVEPLIGLLLVPGVTAEGTVPLDAVRAWWDSAGPMAEVSARRRAREPEIWREKVTSRSACSTTAACGDGTPRRSRSRTSAKPSPSS